MNRRESLGAGCLEPDLTLASASVTSTWISLSPLKNSWASTFLFPSKLSKFLKTLPRPLIVLAPLELIWALIFSRTEHKHEELLERQFISVKLGDKRVLNDVSVTAKVGQFETDTCLTSKSPTACLSFTCWPCGSVRLGQSLVSSVRAKSLDEEVIVGRWG